MNLKLMRAEWRAVRRAALRLTHNSLSMVGLATIGAVAVFATHPQFLPRIADSVRGLVLPATPTAVAATLPSETIAAAIVAPGGEASRILGLSESDATKLAVSNDQTSVERTVPAPRERKEAISYLSKKYRVNGDAIGILVDAAYATGRELNLDPLLLLSVMAVESGFNPFAESTAGASGLMQLMSKVHADKLADFGGANIALNPVVNLRVGAVVLKDCIRRGGSVADGLRLYVGAGTGDDAGYGSRVLQEKDKLALAVRGARPRIEPIPAAAGPTTARIQARAKAQPDIDHSLDNADPSDPKFDEHAKRVATL